MLLDLHARLTWQRKNQIRYSENTGACERRLAKACACAWSILYTSKYVKHVLHTSTPVPVDLPCKTLQGNACMQYGVVQPLPSALQTFSLVWPPEFGCWNRFVMGCLAWKTDMGWYGKGLLLPQEMRGSLSTGFRKKSWTPLSRGPGCWAACDPHFVLPYRMLKCFKVLQRCTWSELIGRMKIPVDLPFVMEDNMNMYKHLNTCTWFSIL